eukprot:CAMPEP_0180643352 /NCGR_PEP_ID=MMETSP1037_2-20121125/47763_1 /TAXON_ID=632150 /ORGANISM="Azadinium spinosum, Strain 3D9" /LENGTH=77 /DNA_ID=CAMNT_0022666843 /DNA_START=30 /DNA_END=260 /DNA_ORIENTATION=+
MTDSSSPDVASTRSYFASTKAPCPVAMALFWLQHTPIVAPAFTEEVAIGDEHKTAVRACPLLLAAGDSDLAVSAKAT